MTCAGPGGTPPVTNDSCMQTIMFLDLAGSDEWSFSGRDALFAAAPAPPIDGRVADLRSKVSTMESRTSQFDHRTLGLVTIGSVVRDIIVAHSVLLGFFCQWAQHKCGCSLPI